LWDFCAERGGGSKNDALQSRVVDDTWLDLPLDAPKRKNGRNGSKGRNSSALQRDRMNDETFGFDGSSAVVDVGRNMNLKFRAARAIGNRFSRKAKSSLTT
jgi:hypothetical protein